MRVVGRYALYDEIAAGGMATVHFGRLLGPVGFSRTVAVKRLHPQYAKDPEFVAMFLDEARLAARIRHPNVVPTLDVVATEGELFLVMDYVQGESLSRLVRAARSQGQSVPLAVVTAILSGTLHGLHAAHEAKNERGEPLGIVHRDVSPQNILVGVDGVPRVLDFGVAKAAGRAQTTREGQIKGKLAYMPPEQLRGGIISRAVDIYAASVVLWETLTAQRLFAGDNEGEILAKVLEAEVPPPSRLVPGLPRALDEVTLRGLARDRQARFATAREMALALERCTRLAPPSEVGEWVERTAGQVLVMRAQNLAEIESISSHVPLTAIPTPPPAAPAKPSEPSGPASAKADGVSSSQLSSISVAKSGVPEAHAAPASRRRGWVWGGAMLVVALGAAGAFREISARKEAASQPSEAVPSAAPPPSSSAAEAAASAASTVAAPSASASPSAASASASASAVVVKPPPPPPRPRHPSKLEGCDPPYTIDAEGHKHYKLNCL